MIIDYNAVIEILKNFLENEKTEILGISVGEERQVRDAIKNLLTAYEKEKEKNKNLEQENSFLKMMYRGTDEFKAIENLAKEE